MPAPTTLAPAAICMSAKAAAGEESEKSSMSASVFNLAKNILGAGMLSLPSGVAAFSDSRCAAVELDVCRSWALDVS